MGTILKPKSPPLSRYEQIKRDIEALRAKPVGLACPDWYPEYAAKILEQDELAGRGEWPSKEKRPQPKP